MLVVPKQGHISINIFVLLVFTPPGTEVFRGMKLSAALKGDTKCITLCIKFEAHVHLH